MASTRSTLEQAAANLDESIGVRSTFLRPQLSPIASPKDAGRTRLRNVGSIDIEQVVPDPHQPRVEFADESLERLAQSIREKGQLLPIHVRWSADVEKWTIISGERRWRATKAAGLTKIDCYFHEGELSQAEILEQQLVENLLREDLKPIEEASAFATLMELNDWNGKQVAESLHIAPSKVSRSLMLLDLPEDIQRQVNEGVIAARSAYELSKLRNDKARRQLAEKAADGMTQKQTANAVRQRLGKSKAKPRKTKLTFDAADGWTVIVSANKKGSYHEVEQALRQVLDEVRHRIDNNEQNL